MRIIGIRGISQGGSESLNLVEVHLDAALSEMDYIALNVCIGDFPEGNGHFVEDSWGVCVSQNDYDRINGQASLSLVNGGESVGVSFDDDEKSEVYQILKLHEGLLPPHFSITPSTKLVYCHGRKKYE